MRKGSVTLWFFVKRHWFLDTHKNSKGKKAVHATVPMFSLHTDSGTRAQHTITCTPLGCSALLVVVRGASILLVVVALFQGNVVGLVLVVVFQ